MHQTCNGMITLKTHWYSSHGNSFFANLLNAFSINKVQTEVNYYFDEHSHIKGNITNSFFGVEINTSIKLNPINGFNEIKINNYTLINNESNN